MKALLVLCVWGVLTTLIAAQENIVTTKYGPVKGLVFDNYRRFQGVPFAQPPLGNLRWKNPVAPSPWTEVKDCTNFNIGCAQSAHSMDVPTNTSEDCLYLELWTPRVGKHKDPAAVMLFFYGGDFKEGGESFAIYDGAWMSSTSNTIVVVTNYRIACFGFLYTPETDHNVGLADQRFSLQWIHDNIAAFGGDPNKVTIFGQSAGGESVLIHMSAPKSPAASLFHRGIVESGPLAINFKETYAGELLAAVFALELGCKDLHDLSCMQSKTTEEVLKAADKSVIPPLDLSEAIMQWSPVVTQDIEFPMQPLQAFQSGAIVNVPLIVGSNKDDGMLFGWVISSGPMPAYEYVAIVAGIFHDNWVPTILEYYPAVDGDNRNVTSLLINDYLFLCSSRMTVRLAETSNLDKTYLYQFARVPPMCPWPDHQKFCCKYVCHGDELAYVFHDSGAPFPWNFTGIDASLAAAMSNYWASFAMHGDPNKYNTQGVPDWPIYRTATDLDMQLNWPLKSESGLLKEKCDMWDQVGYYHKRDKILDTIRNVRSKRRQI